MQFDDLVVGNRVTSSSGGYFFMREMWLCWILSETRVVAENHIADRVSSSVFLQLNYQSKRYYMPVRWLWVLTLSSCLEKMSTC